MQLCVCWSEQTLTQGLLLPSSPLSCPGVGGSSDAVRIFSRILSGSTRSALFPSTCERQTRSLVAPRSSRPKWLEPSPWRQGVVGNMVSSTSCRAGHPLVPCPPLPPVSPFHLPAVLLTSIVFALLSIGLSLQWPLGVDLRCLVRDADIRFFLDLSW